MHFLHVDDIKQSREKKMTVGSDKPQILILITKHWYCI